MPPLIFDRSFWNSISAREVDRRDTFVSFLPEEWSDGSRISYLYAGLDHKVAFDADDAIPSGYLALLAKSNGLRLFGGSVVLYGLLDGRDRFGERDGPVPISIEDKLEIFSHTQPELWGEGYRPIGAIAEERLETLLGSTRSNSVFVLSGDNTVRELLPMELLFGETLTVFRRVASGSLELKNLSARTFVEGLA